MTFPTCHHARMKTLKLSFTDGSTGTRWISRCLWLSSVEVLPTTWMWSVKTTYRRISSLVLALALEILFGLHSHQWVLCLSSLPALTRTLSLNSATTAGIIWLLWSVSRAALNTKFNLIRSPTMVRVCQCWRTMNNSRSSHNSLAFADGPSSCSILQILSMLNCRLPMVSSA